ncbi:MAG TPA: aminotransferase class I and II, partial [Niabella sp.]|nr:aminotransferase class I and II [Niabella sp.]
ELWLIDHGASLYFHHNWDSSATQMKSTFPLIKDHVLLKDAALLKEADEYGREVLSDQVIAEIIEALPAEWLAYEETAGETEETRKVYRDFLTYRLNHSDLFVNQAINARAAII